MQEEINQLKILVEELTKRLDAFYNYSTIPLEVGNAFKARLLPSSFPVAEVISGTPTAQTVNEGGVALYSVSAPFSGKLQITLPNGTVKVVPTI